MKSENVDGNSKSVKLDIRKRRRQFKGQDKTIAANKRKDFPQSCTENATELHRDNKCR